MPSDSAADRPLDQFAIGASGTITAVGGDAVLRRRLLEMGFCTGVAVSVVRVAPFGDPIEVLVRGYHLSVRRAEAAWLRLRPTAPGRAPERTPAGAPVAGDAA